jgi:hypothetical protein
MPIWSEMPETFCKRCKQPMVDDLGNYHVVDGVAVWRQGRFLCLDCRGGSGYETGVPRDCYTHIYCKRNGHISRNKR